MGGKRCISAVKMGVHCEYREHAQYAGMLIGNRSHLSQVSFRIYKILNICERTEGTEVG